MNTIYRLVWSGILCNWVVAAESAKSGRKGNATSVAVRGGVAALLRLTLFVAGMLLVGTGLAPMHAFAQTVDVPADSELATYAGTTAPADGAIWNLTGSGIYLSSNVALPANGTFTLNGNGNTLTLNNGSGTYGKFIGAGPTTFNLPDITITGGATGDNGGVLNLRRTSADVGLTISSGDAALVLTGNQATTSATVSTSSSYTTAFGGNGGSVFTSTSVSTVACGSGNACVSNTSSLNGASIRLSNNQASSGPVSGSTYAPAYGGNGGAVFAGSYAAPYSSSYVANSLISMTADSIELSANRATSANLYPDPDSYNLIYGGNGGALAAAGTAINNSASGTVALMGGTLALSGNLAASGGISTSEQYESVFGGNGGAIFASGASISSGPLLSGNVTLSGSQLTLQNNQATSGAIYSDPTAFGYDLLYGGNGGAIFANSTEIAGTVLLHSTVSLNGSAIVLSQNQASSGNISADNGAVYGGNGGAIFAGSAYGVGGLVSSAVTLTGGEITLSNNRATSGTVSGAGSNGGNGGAIYSGGTVALTGDEITLSNNTATSGAVSGGGSGGNGGAIYSSAATTLAGSAIALANNAATGNGGGIYAASVGVTGPLSASGNTAADNGGAIYATAGDVVQDAGDISMTGNAASAGNGGVIDAAAGNVSLMATSGNTTVSGNSAGGSGGAIYASGAVALGNTAGVMSVTGNSAGAAGGAIWSGGKVTLSGTDIGNNTASGDGGAIYATGDFTLNTTTADAISNNTAGGNGGAIWAGGDVTLNAVNGGLTFSGNAQGSGANAIWMDNVGGASGTPATLVLNAAGHPITFYDPVEDNPANGLIAVLTTGSNTVTFDGSRYGSAADRWSPVYGNTDVQGGATLAVQNNAVYGALAADVGESAPSSLTVDAGATLAGGTVGTVRADNVTLNGTLNVAGSAPTGNASGGYSTFNVTGGNVRFGSGSQVLFNTHLNDASVQRTDLLALDLNGGRTSGTAGVLVNNTGGAGAQTEGNGIELVQTLNGSSANAFTLARPVEAGAWQYLLYQGGVGTDAANGNWYLRSFFQEPCNGGNGGGNGGNGGSGNGGNGNGGNGNGGVCNGGQPEPGPVAWRPGVVAYTMTPLLNLDYGFSMLGTLHQRVGDVPGAIDPQQNTATNGVWGRVDARSFDADALGRFSANSTTYFAQFGKDWTLDQPKDGGSTHAGVTATLGNTSATFQDPLRAMAGQDTQTGTVSTQAWSLGGYWTRYLKDGTYFDSVGQLTYYHNRFGGLDGSASQNGVGAVLSQEVGKPFQIGSTPIAFEPQAQLMYQYLSLGDFSDAISPVSGTHTNALRGRLGFRIFGANLPSSDDRNPLNRAKPYLTFNVLHDFFRPGQTVVGETAFNPMLSRTWYDVGAGVTAAAGKHGELYAHGGYQHNVGGGYGQGFYGQLAYRYMW
jgi:outer membrane autotransporter protein